MTRRLAPAHVRVEEIAPELRLHSPYRGIVTGRPALRLRIEIVSRGACSRELVVDVDDVAVEVHDGDDGFALHAGAIDQLFVVERQPRTGFLTWFGVFARHRGSVDRLLVETPDGRVARFVERTIEDRLDLADEPVRGELRLAL